MTPKKDIDVLENSLRRRGGLLDVLLIDRTTKKNIIWATDSYNKTGKNNSPFASKKQIKPEFVTGIYGRLIQPRAVKSLEEQKRRTRDKAEVFTPLTIVEQMNKMVDWSNGFPSTIGLMKQYVKELKLEITCGEAPFIVTRYNPTTHGQLIKIKNRVGFLDRKLHVVSQNCDKPKDWIYWAKEAYKSSYGYEWQGDNILIARENLLYTLIDYYVDKFGRRPPLKIQQEFAEIISWNIFQMDGLKYVIPMSCKKEIMKGEEIPRNQLSLLPVEKKQKIMIECEGCRIGDSHKHTGKYVKIMDWENNKPIKFVNLLSSLKKSDIDKIIQQANNNV